MSSLTELLPAGLVTRLRNLRDMKIWADRGYPVPLPDVAKRSVLKRYGYPHATWVETGTFYGHTTDFLAAFSPRVISLEPADFLYKRAVGVFAGRSNIEIINATSEDTFPKLIPTLTGRVNFWLDGHYSAGVTFEGATRSPLYSELAEIEKALPRLDGVAIMIDDVRLCGPMRLAEEDGYPTLRELIAWADRNGLPWLIEHDIFVMTSHFPKA